MVEIKHFIAGEWVSSPNGEAWPLRSPSTGEVLGEAKLGTESEVDQAVVAAHSAKSQFAALTVFERAELLDAIADCLTAEKETIAHDLSLEQGKPYHSEAIGEVDRAVHMWREAAEIIRHLETDVLPSHDPNKRVITIRQPRGVYGVITPWNFPATIATEYLCAGLAAGNAIVWKPSEFTPLTAVHITRCCERAGLPAGVLNLLIGDGPTVGHAIASHPEINAIGLTGSAATGDKVAKTAGAKPVLLELGGNCPSIIFEDADIEAAIRRTAYGSFANAGQICSAVDRILVHEKVHDQVVEGLIRASEAIRLGPSLDAESTMGPMNNEHTADKVDRHLQDARAKGAETLTGGGRAEGFPTDLYYRPTVLDGVKPDMLVSREETFGPVAPVLTFSSVNEALELANDSEYGLVAGVFTKDLSRAMYLGERLETGIVNINEVPTNWQSHTPFGGRSGKRSGVGRLGGKYTIMEMSQLKTLVFDVRIESPKTLLS